MNMHIGQIRMSKILGKGVGQIASIESVVDVVDSFQTQLFNQA